MANNTTPTVRVNRSPESKHILRTLCAACLGCLALLLIFASLIVVWLNQTLTNETVFVDTVSPLSSNAAVQDFVTEKAVAQILASAPPQALAQALLTPSQISGQTDTQIMAELQPAAGAIVRSILASPQFASLWTQTLRSAHQQFLGQLNSNAPVITLDLHPAVLGVLGQLQTTKLAPLGPALSLPANAGTLTLKGATIEKVRAYYDLFQKLTIAIVVAAIVLAAACVLISVHHLKTLRRIAVGIGVVLLLLAAALQSPAFVVQSTDDTEKRAAVAVASTLFHNLQAVSLTIGVICIVAAVLSKVVSVVAAKRTAPQAVSSK